MEEKGENGETIQMDEGRIFDVDVQSKGDQDWTQCGSGWVKYKFRSHENSIIYKKLYEKINIY